MDENDWLAEEFEMHRGRMKTVASRMLGSSTEADDAVQEAWLRFNRSDTGSIENLGAWLTTVVSRVCLNMLQTRRSHPAVPMEPDLPDPPASPVTGSDPEQEALLADSVGLASLVVLGDLECDHRHDHRSDGLQAGSGHQGTEMGGEGIEVFFTVPDIEDGDALTLAEATVHLHALRFNSGGPKLVVDAPVLVFGHVCRTDVDTDHRCHPSLGPWLS
jgi:hypothetical protein